MYEIQQGTTAYPLVFLLVLTSDHISPATGKSPTVTISKNGGSFGSPVGAVTEIANGWYKVAGNAADSAALGPLILHATEADSDPLDILYRVVAYDPHDAAGLGLTTLDTNIGSRLASADITLASGKVTPIDVDGLTYAKAMEVIMAALLNVAAPSGSTVVFKKRDGLTTTLTITYGTQDGERTGSAIS